MIEDVGISATAEYAERFGMGTMPRVPSLALGAGEVTMLSLVSAYGAFANGGTLVEPHLIRKVTTSSGEVLYESTTVEHDVVTPATAFLVTSMLEDVVNAGTGSGVRRAGFRLPAAGKTGTSHDGWFAGFTPNLLCVVWVGFDDNRELGISGASSAAPVWAEFMKRATALPAWSSNEGFSPPEGIVTLTIDPETLQLATPSCPVTRQEYFVSGTAPIEFCVRHGGRMLSQVPPVSWLSGLFGGKKADQAQRDATTETPQSPEAPPGTEPGATVSKQEAQGQPSSPGSQTAEEGKKKNLLQRVFGIFGGGKKTEKTEKKPKPGPSKP